MLDLAIEKIGDGGQADMRVRPHVEPPARRKGDRPHVIEENERTDHAPAAERQDAPDFEAADIAQAALSDLRYCSHLTTFPGPRHEDQGFHTAGLQRT